MKRKNAKKSSSSFPICQVLHLLHCTIQLYLPLHMTHDTWLCICTYKYVNANIYMTTWPQAKTRNTSKREMRTSWISAVPSLRPTCTRSPTCYQVLYCTVGTVSTVSTGGAEEMITSQWNNDTILYLSSAVTATYRNWYDILLYWVLIHGWVLGILIYSFLCV